DPLVARRARYGHRLSFSAFRVELKPLQMTSTTRERERADLCERRRRTFVRDHVECGAGGPAGCRVGQERPAAHLPFDSCPYRSLQAEGDLLERHWIASDLPRRTGDDDVEPVVRRPLRDWEHECR